MLPVGFRSRGSANPTRHGQTWSGILNLFHQPLAGGGALPRDLNPRHGIVLDRQGAAPPAPYFSNAACAAASFAIGTRNGLQLT
jgi:hypothetical protein